MQGARLTASTESQRRPFSGDVERQTERGGIEPASKVVPFAAGPAAPAVWLPPIVVRRMLFTHFDARNFDPTPIILLDLHKH